MWSRQPDGAADVMARQEIQCAAADATARQRPRDHRFPPSLPLYRIAPEVRNPLSRLEARSQYRIICKLSCPTFAVHGDP